MGISCFSANHTTFKEKEQRLVVMDNVTEWSVGLVQSLHHHLIEIKLALTLI
jgi:hypothetical protein